MSETPLTPASPSTVAEQRSAQEAEWGTYVALVPIDVYGARAFNTGDPVPVSHVDRGVVREDQVAKTTTKAGRTASGIEKG